MKAKKNLKEGLSPLVSIVINFYNEVNNIDYALSCLVNQSYKNFEVILVDDGSTDGTSEEILRKGYFQTLPNCKLIRIKHCGLVCARRVGILNAKGDIIVVLDMHTIFRENLIEDIVKIFSQNELLAAVSMKVVPFGRRWFIKGLNILNELVDLINNTIFKRYSFIRGGGAAYNRLLLETKGIQLYSFPDDIPEDIFLSWEIHKKHLKIEYHPELIIYHVESENFISHLKRYFKNGCQLKKLIRHYKHKLVYPQILLRILFLPSLILTPLLLPLNALFFILCSLTSSLVFALIVLSRKGFLKAKLTEIPYFLVVLFLFLSISFLGILSSLIRDVKP